MKTHRKKIAAVLAVAAILIIYYILYFAALVAFLPDPWRWLAGIVPVFAAAGLIWAAVQRIQEIKEGEEDDLGQY